MVAVLLRLKSKLTTGRNPFLVVRVWDDFADYLVQVRLRGKVRRDGAWKFAAFQMFLAISARKFVVKLIFHWTEFSERSDILLYLLSFQAELTVMIQSRT